jgi:hypothetical protein
MTEISKVYLYSKAPLRPAQETVCLSDIMEQAKKGFRVELQQDVLAHARDEAIVFTVRRIEPPNKFYGSVDGDTAFEILHDEEKLPPPQTEKCGVFKVPPCDESILITEVDRLRLFIGELEALRVKHGVSWGCLRKVIEAIDQFGDETAPTL